MPKNTVPKPPVKPIGRILYSQQFGKHDHNTGTRRPADFDKVCDCKGHSKDRPFSVYKATSEAVERPFKLVFYWLNPKPKQKATRVYGETEMRDDHDDLYMTDILQEFASKHAAVKAMRAMAEASFAKVNDRVTDPNRPLHTKGDQDELKLRIGDLVSNTTSREGIVWTVVGEKRKSDQWYTVLAPVLSLLHGSTPKQVELSPREMWNVKAIDLVDLASTYSRLGMLLKEEATRRSE